MPRTADAWKAIEAPVMPPRCDFDRCFMVANTAVPGEYLCTVYGWSACFATLAEARAEADRQNELEN